MSLDMNVLLEQIFGVALFFLRLLSDSLLHLTRQAGDHLGVWGQAGLYLLMALFGLWVVYQLLRILTLIVLRILLPLAAILLTLFVLVILTS